MDGQLSGDGGRLDGRQPEEGRKTRGRTRKSWETRGKGEAGAEERRGAGQRN